MTEEFNFEIWNNDGDAVLQNPIVTKSLWHDGMVKELSMHEASHLVFDCLLIKHFKDFTPIKFAISCAEKINVDDFNRVNGVVPKGYTEHELNNYQTLRKFYRTDKKRTLARILSRLAGYMSYQFFIKDTTYFVGIENRESETITYHNLYTAFNKFQVHDFQNVKVYLGYIDVERNQYFSKTELLLKTVKKTMSIQAVYESIIFVHRQLVKNKCKRIEGIELSKIMMEVSRLTNKVPYIDVLSECEGSI